MSTLGTLGSLVVSLEANIAQFGSDLGRAAQMAEKSMKQISGQVEGVKRSFEALGVGIVLEKLGHFALDVVEAAANLGKLSAATGLSVEQLSAVKNTAAGAGLSVQDAASAFERLEKNAALAVGGNTKLIAWFNAIGMSQRQLAADLKDPQKLLRDTAEAMQRYADDGNKAAAMQEILGRGGAEMSEFLKDLAKNGYENATVTTKQAEAAKEFEVELSKMKTWLEGVALDLTMKFIPWWKKAFADVITYADDFYIKLTGTWDKIINGLQIRLGNNAELDLSGLAKKGLDSLELAWDAFTFNPKTISKLSDLFTSPLEKTKPQAGINQGMAAALAQNERIRAQAQADYDLAQLGGPIEVTAKKMSIKPPTTDATAGLRAALNATLRTLSDAIKTEDALLKAANAQTDADYKVGLISLVDYANQKNKALKDNATNTSSLYIQEIQAAAKFARSVQDPTERAAAMSKVADLVERATAAYVESGEKSTKALEDTRAEGERFARSMTDLNIEYETMQGHTETATKLQDEQTYGLLRARLQTAGYTEDLAKLDKVIADIDLRSNRGAFAGMQRAVIDYSKGLADVAKQTEAMTTRMLQGMEDALVTFVQTGKLNWRSLIDSMIADLIRLQIRQSVMPGIASFFGNLIGGEYGASTAVSYVPDTMGAASAIGLAGGGDVIVGERGPERFRPAVSGTVLPNGAGSGMSLVYSPTIQIDSRSDRAQVQQDTAAIVRKGQEELVSVLRRYNPGLRV